MKDLSQVTQKFAVSQANGDADYKGDGLRKYALYRDFGFADATEGMVHAHIIKLIPPCTDEVRQRHRHLLQMQMVYCLKGWMKIEHEGQGVMTMKAGDAWLMPYERLISRGSMATCREHGEVRLEGKDYVVLDGDIINFRFAT